MRVAIVGPSPSALILADDLKAEVYGYPWGASPKGAFHLWSTPAVQAYLEYPPTYEVKVKWLRGGKLEDYCTKEDLCGYHVRRGDFPGDTPVCGGCTEFNAVAWRYLTHKTREWGRHYYPEVLNARRRSGRWELETSVCGGFADVLVVGTPPWVTVKWLEGFSWKPDLAQANFVHFAHLLPNYYPKVASNTLIYTAEEAWYRIARGESGVSVEAPIHLPGCWNEVHRIATRVRGIASYPVGCVPVGRFPELKEELMVHDIIEQRSSYVERVRRAAEEILGS